MFGSLVVIFPTPHKGGTLILRHDGKEHSFDSGLELSRLEQPSIGFVAFYSDVEHEVAIVESGYRLTLTYNLYVSTPAQRPVIPNIPSANTDTLNDLSLKQALSDLLAEKEFLPEGGTVGFGLRHKYPVSKTDGTLESVLGCLKGSDASIRRVCSSLGLELKPKVIYKGTEEEVFILVDEFPKLEYVDASLERYLCSDEYGPPKGVIVKPCGLEENCGDIGEFEDDSDDSDDSGEYQYQEVWWLTKRTELTREKTDFLAYGNESTLTHTYGDVVLIASVGEHANRQTIQNTHKRRRMD